MSLISFQIREELIYHNIRLYPFDTDEDEEEEITVNENIRVSRFIYDSVFSEVDGLVAYRRSFLSLWLVQRTT